MFPVRLVQLIEAHADNLSEGLIRKLRSSRRCDELFRKVSADELKRRSYEIYRHLSDWMIAKTESEIEERYVGLGIRRAKQGVPFSQFLWAITVTKEHLWDCLQREGLLEEPVDFYGEMQLLKSLERFFESALYFASTGYESVQQTAGEHTASAHSVLMERAG
jgi:hypothetical protein